MKTKMNIMLTVLALGASAFVASAQDGNSGPGGDGPRGPGPNGHRPPPPLIAALDVNHDGVISADEIANAPAALKTLDKNGDGQLTQDELRPQLPPPHDGSTNGVPRGPGPNGHRPPPSPVFAALDTNHDGVISADEIANAPAALKTLDKNGDGQLTRDELRPQHPPHAEGGPGGDGNQPPDGAPSGPPPDQQ